MRSLTLVCAMAAVALALAVSAQPTRPPTAPPTPPATEPKAAAATPAPTPAPDKPIAPSKPAAEIVADPLKVAALGPSNQSINSTTANRYLIVAGRGEYTVWANLAQIFVSVEPRVIQSAVTGAGPNATQTSPDSLVPDAKAKDEIKKVYERVIGVLEKYKAISISSPPSFVSSPMFEPNVTAFKMFMEHQRQMMMRRRKALAQRMGRNLLLPGRPLSLNDKPFAPSPFVSSRQAGLMHRSNIRDVSAIRQAPWDEGVEPAPTPQPANPPTAPPATPLAAPAKPEEAKKDVKVDVKADAKESAADKQNATAKLEKDDEPMVPLPDPKSLITFKGFRFYRPLSAVVPIESVIEIAHSLRAANATIESVQLALSPRAFDEARAFASKSAIERALVVADAALSAAGEKRVKLETVLITSSSEPHLPRVPMFRAAFLRPQAVPVVSQVILRVTF